MNKGTRRKGYKKKNKENYKQMTSVFKNIYDTTTKKNIWIFTKETILIKINICKYNNKICANI